MSWAQFLKLHWEVLAATDFFTVEVATWHGLVTYYVLVVMELATRRVRLPASPPSHRGLHAAVRPTVDGPVRGVPPGQALSHPRQRHEIHAGVRWASQGQWCGPDRLTARSPNLNAHCERFVRSIKEEALAQMVMLGETLPVLCDPTVLGPLSSRAQSSGPRQPTHCSGARAKTIKTRQSCAEIVSVGCSATITERRRDARRCFTSALRRRGRWPRSRRDGEEQGTLHERQRRTALRMMGAPLSF